MKDFMKAEGDFRDPGFNEQFKINPDRINDVFNAYLEKRHNYTMLENKEKGDKYLAKMAKQAGVEKTESGLLYKIVEAGSEVKPEPVDTVWVKYKGTLIDGKVFDETAEDAEPVKFPLNGVILVTTKDAKGDKFTISYNGSYSYNDRTIKWEDNIVTDGLEWTEAFFDFFKGDSVTPTSAGKTPSQINTWAFNAGYLETFRNRRIAGNYDVFDDTSGVYQYYGSTNWLPLFYKRSTTNTTHDISVRGSSKKISYSLTGRYYTQSGLYKIGDDAYDQFNIRSKVKLNVTDWLTITNNTSLFRTNQKQSMFTTGSVLGKQIDQHGQPVGIPGLVGSDGLGYITFEGDVAYGSAESLEQRSGEGKALDGVALSVEDALEVLDRCDFLAGDVDVGLKGKLADGGSVGGLA